MSGGQQPDAVWKIEGPLPQKGDTWVLEASAGTGKTYQIASLVLRLVAEAGVKIEKVLAITFTNAATGELRDRIRARLVEALAALRDPEAYKRKSTEDQDAVVMALLEGDEATLKQRRVRLEDAVRDIDLATISTIHSFSQSILRGHALEAGHSAQLEVMGDLSAIHGRVVEDALVRLWSTVTPEAASLYKAVGFNLSNLKKVVSVVSKYPASTWVPALADGGIEAHRQRDEDLVEAWLADQVAFRNENRDRWEPALRAIHEERQKDDARPTKDKFFNGTKLQAQTASKHAQCAVPARQCDPFVLASGQGGDGVSASDLAIHYVGAKVGGGIKKLEIAKTQSWWPFVEACERIVAAAQAFVRDFSPFVPFAASVAPQVEAELLRARAMTFDHMVSLVAQRMAESDGEDSPLAQRVRERYDAVLVDEFQDTDEGQWTIIRSAFHGHARLLLIGDPKQAIYAFRGADLSVYLSARDEAHKQFTMTTNFRSDPVTIDAQNALWQAKPVESSAFDVEGINYIEVKAHKAARLEPAKPGLEIRWVDGRAASAQGTRGSPIDGKGRGQAIAAALAAAEVKALLASTTTLKTKKLTDERLRPRDFGVLVENRYEAAAMRKALAALGIPAVAAAQGTVFASPAADWLVRWLDAVAEPSSRDIAARIVATTPLFGMSHQALATALEAEAERLAGGALVSTTGGHESVTRWAAVRAMLASARAAWRNDRFVGCFERTLSAPKGGLPCVLAQPMGERLATDLRHLVELLNERDRTRRSGPADLAQWLRLQRDEEGREFEQRLESDENAVRIETVFVSKGLQYPIVLLPFAWSQKTQPKTASALAAGRPANAGLTVRPRVGLGKQGFAALQAEVAEQSRTEALRKDYVALTRAEHLTIMWVGPIGQSNQPQKKVTKYLGGSTYHTLLRRVVDPDEQKPIAEFIDGLVEKFGKPEASPHTRFVEVTFDDVEKARREEAGSPKKTDQNSTETLDDAEKVRCEEACSPEKTDQTGPKALEKRTWNRKTSLGAGFGVTSFSELKGQGALHDADEKSRASARDDQPEGESADDGDEATFTSALTEPGEPDSDAAPLVLEGRGTEYGSFVHALYEHLDFETGRAKSGEPLESLVITQGQAFGFDRGARAGAGARDFAVKVLDGITAHLPLTLRTPLDALPEAGAAGLGAAPAGTTLADLSINSRLDELVFDLRLGIGLRDRAGGGTPVRVETRHALAALLSHPRKDDPTWHGSAWLKSLEARDKERHQERDPERDQESGPTGGLFKNMDGFLTGSIDLVFERGGRYWVADYKTNRIKDSRPGYYGTEWMAWEMARKGYPLQSLIYTLALHRHLKQRVRDYDYDTHVGGALYLFVRGMTGPETPRDLKTGTALGVLADRWPRAVVEGVEVALGLTTQGRTR